MRKQINAVREGLNEGATLLDNKGLTEKVLKSGFILIDKEGDLRFVVCQINDKNFTDISKLLREQLEDEGKEDFWVGFITHRKGPSYSINDLPIYGNKNTYVTSWLTKNAEESIKSNLGDRNKQLLSRANDYLKNSKINNDDEELKSMGDTLTKRGK